MKISIDTTSSTVLIEDNGPSRVVDLYSDEAFDLISRYWLKVGWNQKYSYTFTWLGRPIIQLPEDMLRLQEAIYLVRPDVIIETGIAHGGSLIYSASLCKLMNRGRVIGIDIEIRPDSRAEIERHELAPYITMLEGDSVATTTVNQVRSLLAPTDNTLVILDSRHTKSHVKRELEAYHTIVTPGSYIVATDGIMQDLNDVPRGAPEWRSDHPSAAATEFAQEHPEFTLAAPRWPFNESTLTHGVTYWPSAWLRRRA